VTSLSLAAGQLRAAEAATDTPDDRVRSGILVPWGEPGRTNLGLKKVHRGALTLTADAKIVGIYGHNREAAVSRVVSTEDRPEGCSAASRSPGRRWVTSCSPRSMTAPATPCPSSSVTWSSTRPVT
jgi:hypothetical protein